MLIFVVLFLPLLASTVFVAAVVAAAVACVCTGELMRRSSRRSACLPSSSSSWRRAPVRRPNPWSSTSAGIERPMTTSWKTVGGGGERFNKYENETLSNMKFIKTLTSV